MDLMRAVIIGAEGTPYHDGLFFFDLYLPDDFPNVYHQYVADDVLYLTDIIPLSLFLF
jgi:hypothetical protein